MTKKTKPGKVSYSAKIMTSNHTNYVEDERNESVMCCKRKEHLVHKNNVLEVVDHALSVEKVHGRPEEVPIERPSESEPPCPAWDV